MPTILIAAALFFAPAPTTVAATHVWLLEQDAAAAFRPVEVASETGFIVHAIPRSTDRGWMPTWTLLGQDYILTHTLLPAGKLKVLMRSGVVVSGGLPKGINTIGYQKTEFLGVAVKGTRVAVLTRHFVGGVVLTPSAPKTPSYGKPYHRLTLFDARDGEQLSELILRQVEVPEVGRLREIGPGPLKLEQDRISLWNRTVRIDQQGRMILEAKTKE